jgi:hypothetical protein
LPKIEEDGKKSWLRRPKLYKGVVEPYKKKKKSWKRGMYRYSVRNGVSMLRFQHHYVLS